MNRGLGNMARPYLEELEAMLATDLTEEEGFDYNDFDDKLMEIEQGLMEIPDSATRSKALRLLSQVKSNTMYSMQMANSKRCSMTRIWKR